MLDKNDYCYSSIEVHCANCGKNQTVKILKGLSFDYTAKFFTM